MTVVGHISYECGMTRVHFDREEFNSVSILLEIMCFTFAVLFLMHDF